MGGVTVPGGEVVVVMLRGGEGGRGERFSSSSSSISNISHLYVKCTERLNDCGISKWTLISPLQSTVGWSDC